MSQNDATYFCRRAVTERALAEAAAHPKVSAVHRELAERYESLATDRKPSAGVEVASAIPVAA
jgi:hypothetical protein